MVITYYLIESGKQFFHCSC